MVVDDVVVAVSVEVCAAALLIETEAGERLQVAGLVAPEGELVTEQERETVPVNEFEGVTLTVDVFPLVAPGATLMLPLLVRVKLVLVLLVFGGSQNPEQPTAKATMSGAAANNNLPHLPVFIAVPHFPFSCTGHDRRSRQGSVPLLKDIACVLDQEKYWAQAAEDRDAETPGSAHALAGRAGRHEGNLTQSSGRGSTQKLPGLIRQLRSISFR